MIGEEVRRLRAQGRIDLALDRLRAESDARKSDPAMQQQVGVLFRELGASDEAEAAFRRAAVLAPDSPFVRVNIAIVLQERGEPAAAAVEFKAAAEARPNKTAFIDNLLLNAQYVPGVTAGSLFHLHGKWRDRFTASQPLPGNATQPDPTRMLRIGFVSADFAQHPVGYFMLPLFRELDRNACEVHAFASGRRRDQMSEQFRALADGWHEIGELADPAAAALIASRKIDVLFDMAGHAFNNRLGVFALKPAPLQISWAGYVGTVGVPAIDYVLADAVQAPPEEDCWYHEKVLRLSRCYVPYQPADDGPDVGPLPASRNGFVTFGCFNSPSKLNGEVIALWARLMAQVPNSRLALRFRGMDSAANMRRVHQILGAAGVVPARVSFAGLSSHRQMLDAYNTIDIALDPFPYSGGVTTCEALWMGVPVITRKGSTFAGRHTSSYLTAVGLPEFITTNDDAYLATADNLARDTTRLAALRGGLRQRFAASSVMDHAGYARDFLAALRQISGLG